MQDTELSLTQNKNLRIRAWCISCGLGFNKGSYVNKQFNGAKSKVIQETKSRGLHNSERGE